MKHIIALLVENEAGALSRVVGLFSARGYNIESLTVATTEDPSLSRMTIVTTGSDDIIEFLVSRGASLDVKDKEGRTPLAWAEGVFLATHPARPKPSSIELIKKLAAQTSQPTP